jgi:uncharacterized membrane protein YphA (DoxX/SURF4 family)
LVALRLGIGWHFFKEGTKKFTEPGFSSAGFLLQAKGPLAEAYRSMVPDRYGGHSLDMDSLLAAWENYRLRVAAYYGFDESQEAAADAVYKRRADQLRYWFADHGEELQEYDNEVARLIESRASPDVAGVEFGRRRIEAKENELRQKLERWKRELGELRLAYARDLNALATEEQGGGHGGPAIADPASSPLDSVVAWTVLLVGACLILGLFTPVASIVGAVFLAGVIASQWPGSHGAQDTYNQVVEMLALLLLAATRAGRHAGLDFFLYALRMRCCPPKTRDES